MRYGSYSEDSDDSEGREVHKNLDGSCNSKKDSVPDISVTDDGGECSQSNGESSFYSYHSDDEQEDLERIQEQTKNRKRSFVCTDRSPRLKHLSQSTGLTQEINILAIYGDEHRMKRSASGNDLLGVGELQKSESDCQNYRDFAGFTGEHTSQQTENRDATCSSIGGNFENQKNYLSRFEEPMNVGEGEETNLEEQDNSDSEEKGQDDSKV